MAENIVRPDPAGYVDTIWTDQNGQEQIADAKGRWYFYVVPPESGGGTWGSITGTLSAQTDLQAALDAKLSSSTAASTFAPISTKGMRTFADETALLASTPDYIGQLAHAAVTETIWTANALTVGGWSGTFTAQTFGGSGGDLTDLPAGQLTGNAPRSVLNDALSANAAPIVATTVTASGTVSAALSSASGDIVVTPAGNQFALATGKRLAIGTGGGMPMLAESSGTLRIRNVSNNAFYPISCGNITTDGNLTASGTVKTGTYTVGTTPAHAVGAEILISSASGATVGAAVTTGGGSMLVKAASNGSAWICTAIIIP